MKCKALLWTMILMLCAGVLEASQDWDFPFTPDFKWSYFSQSSPCEEIKKTLLETLQKPHDLLDERSIDLFMSHLEMNDIQDVFENIVNYFDKTKGKGELLDEEIMAFQPWSMISFEIVKIWLKSPIFKEYYTPYRKIHAKITQSCKDKTAQEIEGFLTTRPFPLLEKIDPNLYIYVDQYLFLCAFLNTKNKHLYKLFEFAARWHNTPLAFMLIHKYKNAPKIIKTFFRTSVRYGHAGAMRILLKKDRKLWNMRYCD